MKLLAIADVHGDLALIRRLVRRANRKDIDIVVDIGDFTLFNQNMEKILELYGKIRKPVLLIPGNHESNAKVDRLIEKHKYISNIHRKIVKLKGFAFCGYGLGGFGKKDPELRKLTRSWKPRLKKEKLIMLVHGPPYKTVLDELHGGHVGCEDVNYAIKELKPIIAVTGHIHENANRQQKIGSSIVLNPSWEGKVIEIKY